mgnify:FL=1
MQRMDGQPSEEAEKEGKDEWRPRVTGEEYFTGAGEEVPVFENDTKSPPVDRQRLRDVIGDWRVTADDEDADLVTYELPNRFRSWAKANVEVQIELLVEAGYSWWEAYLAIAGPPDIEECRGERSGEDAD